MNKTVGLKIYVIVSSIISLILLLGPNPIAFPPLAIIVGIWLFADRKRLKIDATIYFFVFMCVTSLFLGWPVTRVAKVSGTVTDRITGVPISNAIFEVTWGASSFGILGSGSREIFKKYAVTDEFGHYTIRGQWAFNYILSNSILPHVKLRHPLYETNFFYYDVPFSGYSGGPFAGFWRYKFGHTEYDIQLTSFSDKFKDGRGGGTNDIEAIIRHEMVRYAYQAKKLNVAIDWKHVFSVWDGILNRFGGYTDTAKYEIEMIAV